MIGGKICVRVLWRNKFPGTRLWEISEWFMSIWKSAQIWRWAPAPPPYTKGNTSVACVFYFFIFLTSKPFSDIYNFILSSISVVLVIRKCISFAIKPPRWFHPSWALMISFRVLICIYSMYNKFFSVFVYVTSLSQINVLSGLIVLR